MKALRNDKALDFDDILVVAHRLLARHEPARALSNAWDYLHIDEYQDTNRMVHSSDARKSTAAWSRWGCGPEYLLVARCLY